MTTQTTCKERLSQRFRRTHKRPDPRGTPKKGASFFSMPYFVFRTVKTIERNNTPNDLGGQTANNDGLLHVLTANEYILELEDDTPEILDYVASVLVAAEACLMLSVNFLFVSIFLVELGGTIDTTTPMKICFKTDETVYANENTFLPIIRWEQLSPNFYRSFEQYRVKPLLSNVTLDLRRNPYARPTTVDPWIETRIVRYTRKGDPRHQSYMGCCDETDYYWSPEGKLHIAERGGLASCRFEQYESVMSLLYSIFTNCYFDEQGVLREGEFTFSKVHLYCVSDHKTARRRYRNQQPHMARQTSWFLALFTTVFLFSAQSETLATQEKDLDIFNATAGDKKHPFEQTITNYFNLWNQWGATMCTQVAGQEWKKYQSPNRVAGGNPAVAPRNNNPLFIERWAVIENLIRGYMAFADIYTTPFFNRSNPLFRTTPAKTREAAPVGANYQNPSAFDRDKWMVYTRDAATLIYFNWERYFHTCETSYNILALYEKFLFHLPNTGQTKAPRYYARAVASYDPSRPDGEKNYWIPSRSVSGLLHPNEVARNLRPDAKTTAARVLDPRPGTCPARPAFWFPRMRSITLDRSGYDVRNRRFLTAQERGVEFPTPQPIDPRPITEVGPYNDRQPDNKNISDRQRNCDDLRVKANVTTIIGGQIGINFTVPRPLVAGWKKVVGDNAYLTSDCSQRKNIDLKLPASPIVRVGVETSP